MVIRWLPWPCFAASSRQRNLAYLSEACFGAVLYLQNRRSGPTSTAAYDYNVVNDADVLRFYFWGTAIASSALEAQFLPPHYLSLSQFFKTHGVGALVTGLLSRIGLCCSDKARWTAEETVVQRCQDEDLISRNHDLAVSAAWDNCDTDATAKYESAVHNGNIAATIHVRRSPGTPAQLSGEDKWRKRESVTFKEIENGLPTDKHDDIWKDFKNTIFKVVRRSPIYLSAEDEMSSCSGGGA